MGNAIMLALYIFHYVVEFRLKKNGARMIQILVVIKFMLCCYVASLNQGLLCCVQFGAFGSLRGIPITFQALATLLLQPETLQQQKYHSWYNKYRNASVFYQGWLSSSYIEDSRATQNQELQISLNFGKYIFVNLLEAFYLFSSQKVSQQSPPF